MKKLLAFLTSKTFAANLVLGLVFLVVLFFGLKAWLSATTHHGEKLTVPDLTGLTLEEADESLSETDLRYRVIDSAEYNPDIALGAILEQHPQAGNQVKSNREVLLTINPFVVRKIEVPNIIDKTLRRAVYDLESKGFKVGELIYKPDLAKDVILGFKIGAEEIKPGDKFEKGTTIDLVVGSGLGDERVPVPYLKWLTAEKAELKLLENSLNLGLILYDEEILDSASALVFRQSPEPSHIPKLRLGTTIDIWLTNDSTKIPNDSLSYQYPNMDLDSIRAYFAQDTTL